MPIINIKTRSSKNHLGDLLKTLYEDVLLLCENDEKTKIKNNTTNKKWKEFVKNNQVKFIHNHEIEKGKFKNKIIRNENPLIIDPQYSKKDISDTIIFTNKQNKVFSSLLTHIRNAFCHNQIFIEENKEHITMYDKLNNNFTMIAHVRIDVLKEIIKTIINLK